MGAVSSAVNSVAIWTGIVPNYKGTVDTPPVWWSWGIPNQPDGDVNTYPNRTARDWGPFNEMFNFNDGVTRFNCGPSATPDVTDHRTNFSVEMYFGNLMRRMVQIDDNSDSSVSIGERAGKNDIASADRKQIIAALRNLVNKPWTWAPPGGMFILGAGTVALHPVFGSTTSTNKYTISSPSDKKLLGWEYFEKLVYKKVIDDANIRDWESWEDSDDFIDIPIGELERLGAAANGKIPGHNHKVKKVKVSLNQVYNEFASVRDNAGAFAGWLDIEDDGSGSDKVYPGAIALTIGISITGGHNGSVGTAFENGVMKKAVSKIVDRYALAGLSERNIIVNPTTDTITWLCRDKRDTSKITEIASVLELLANNKGFAIPIDLSDIKFSAKSQVKTLEISTNITFYACGGGAKCVFNSGVYPMHLVGSNIGSLSKKTSIYNIDWRTTLDGTGSPCELLGSKKAKERCRSIQCSPNTSPPVGLNGSCSRYVRGQYNEMLGGAVNDVNLFRETIEDLKYNTGSTLDLIKILIGQLKSTSWWRTSSGKLKDAIEEFQRVFDNFKTGFYDRALNKISKTFPEANKQDILVDNVAYSVCTKVASLSDLNNLVIELKSTIEPMQKAIKNFEGALEDSELFKSSTTQTSSDYSATLDQAFRAVKLALNRQMDKIIAAGDAGTVANNAQEDTSPVKDDDDNDTFDDGLDPRTTDEEDGGGFPTWAIYAIVGVGSLIAIGAIIAIVRKRQKA